MHVLDTNPTLAKHMLRALAQRLRRTNESLSDLVFSDVPGRVAKALLDLADRFGTATDKGVHVPHDLTQEELAQLVGASRETVNKSLADFVSRGWIRLEGRAVTLLDVDRLARRAPLILTRVGSDTERYRAPLASQDTEKAAATHAPECATPATASSMITDASVSSESLTQPSIGRLR